jgi:hypothetical protein
VSLLLLALSVHAALGRDLPAALGSFFVLFLSAPRLSFLESEPPLWMDAFWLRPRVGVGLAMSLFALSLFARRRFVLAGIVLGVAAWTEPRWLLFGGASVVLSPLLDWKRSEPLRRWIGVTVALGLLLLWPATAFPASPVARLGTWHFAVSSLISVSLGQGAVFYLGVFGILGMFRERRPELLLYASWILTAYLFWIAVSVSPDAAAFLDRSLVKSFLRVLLAGAAGWGAHRALLWVDGKWRLRARSAYVVGLAAIVGLSLPWAFPFWWNPVRMDPVYVESVDPISHEYSTFGDWIRGTTPADAAFVAGPSYAAWIPPLSGRRVLLRDEKDRTREDAQAAIAASKDPEKIRSAAREWGVTHLAWGRLDADEPIAVDLAFLNASPTFSLVHQQRRWVRVYQIRPEP